MGPIVREPVSKSECGDVKAASEIIKEGCWCRMQEDEDDLHALFLGSCDAYRKIFMGRETDGVTITAPSTTPLKQNNFPCKSLKLRMCCQ